MKSVSVMRLTVKAVVRWEQLRGKPFARLDGGDREDVEALLYTASECGGGHTWEMFRRALESPKVRRRLTDGLERQLELLGQFRHETSERAADGVTADDGGEPERVSSLVSFLVVSGMDVHYVMEEMELCDVPMFVEAYVRKRREEMEGKRFWTYLSILPHIDASKLERGAADLVTFAWEEAEGRKRREEISPEEAEMFRKLFK